MSIAHLLCIYFITEIYAVFMSLYSSNACDIISFLLICFVHCESSFMRGHQWSETYLKCFCIVGSGWKVFTEIFISVGD